jgi:tellurite resistance protein TerC
MLLIDLYKIPIVWSLGVTVSILAVAMILSLRIPPGEKSGSAYPFPAKSERDAGDRP